MIELFDSHFHYDGEAPDEFMAKFPVDIAFDLMAVAGDYRQSFLARELAGRVGKRGYFAVGVHPHGAEEYCRDGGDFSVFRHEPKLKAIGELGLDYYYGISEKSAQRSVLADFLKLALEWDLPAIIHCRDHEECFDAYQEIYDMLCDFVRDGGRAVVHCFAGTAEWAEKFLEIGCFLGVTGMVTFPKAHNIRESLKVIPLDRLLLETDAPYLSPVPFRGKVNHPAYLIHVAERVAQEKGISLEEIAKITTGNALRFFNIEEDER